MPVVAMWILQFIGKDVEYTASLQVEVLKLCNGSTSQGLIDAELSDDGEARLAPRTW